MMRRNNRRNLLSDEMESKRIVIIAISVLIIAILTFIITFVVYRNYLNRHTDIAEITQLADLSKENIHESSEASSSIGKSVNEMQEDNTNTQTNEIQKIAINTSNMKKENLTTSNEETNANITSKNENTITTSTNTTNVETTETMPKKEEKVPDPTFKKPVEGEITNGFAKDTLIYSNTLQEWVTHNGIDIKADKTTIVKASADGTIKSIKNDPRFGITVVIEHVNGYSSVYSNLLTAEFVKEGEKVMQGQTVGTVGNTATFEIADAPHLHFEILKHNENVNPELYF